MSDSLFRAPSNEFSLKKDSLSHIRALYACCDSLGEIFGRLAIHGIFVFSIYYLCLTEDQNGKPSALSLAFLIGIILIYNGKLIIGILRKTNSTSERSAVIRSFALFCGFIVVLMLSLAILLLTGVYNFETKPPLPSIDYQLESFSRMWESDHMVSDQFDMTVYLPTVKTEFLKASDMSISNWIGIGTKRHDLIPIYNSTNCTTVEGKMCISPCTPLTPHSEVHTCKTDENETGECSLRVVPVLPFQGSNASMPLSCTGNKIQRYVAKWSSLRRVGCRNICPVSMVSSVCGDSANTTSCSNGKDTIYKTHSGWCCDASDNLVFSEVIESVNGNKITSVQGCAQKCLMKFHNNQHACRVLQYNSKTGMCETVHVSSSICPLTPSGNRNCSQHLEIEHVARNASIKIIQSPKVMEYSMGTSETDSWSGLVSSPTKISWKITNDENWNMFIMLQPAVDNELRLPVEIYRSYYSDVQLIISPILCIPMILAIWSCLVCFTSVKVLPPVRLTDEDICAWDYIWSRGPPQFHNIRIMVTLLLVFLSLFLLIQTRLTISMDMPFSNVSWILIFVPVWFLFLLCVSSWYCVMKALYCMKNRLQVGCFLFKSLAVLSMVLLPLFVSAMIWVAYMDHCNPLTLCDFSFVYISMPIIIGWAMHALLCLLILFMSATVYLHNWIVHRKENITLEVQARLRNRNAAQLNHLKAIFMKPETSSAKIVDILVEIRSFQISYEAISLMGRSKLAVLEDMGLAESIWTVEVAKTFGNTLCKVHDAKKQQEPKYEIMRSADLHMNPTKMTIFLIFNPGHLQKLYFEHLLHSSAGPIKHSFKQVHTLIIRTQGNYAMEDDDNVTLLHLKHIQSSNRSMMNVFRRIKVAKSDDAQYHPRYFKVDIRKQEIHFATSILKLNGSPQYVKFSEIISITLSKSNSVDFVILLKPSAIKRFRYKDHLIFRASTEEEARNWVLVLDNCVMLDIEIFTPGNDSVYPENIDLNVEPRAALCFSGGGARSHVGTCGILRALFHAGLLDHKTIPYISSVSGSSWATCIYTFYTRGARSDAELLGELTTPETLDLVSLNKDPCPLIRVATVDMVKEAENLFWSVSWDTWWESTIGATYLEPFGLNENRPFTHHLLLDKIRKQVPLIDMDFYVTLPERPFWIANGVLIGPDWSHADDCVPTQFTPFYSGSPILHDVCTLDRRSKSRRNLRLGGGLVDTFSFGSDKPRRSLSVRLTSLKHGGRKAIGSMLKKDKSTNAIVNLKCEANIAVNAMLSIVRDTFHHQEHKGLLRRPVHVRVPARPLTLRHVLGIVSDAPAFLFKTSKYASALNERSVYWAPLNENNVHESDVKKHPEEEMHFGDGAILDNLGVMAALQRKVRKCMVFMNHEDSLPSPDQLDQWISPSLFSLFGAYTDLEKNANYMHNTVFPQNRLKGLLEKMSAQVVAGNACVVEETYDVLGNDFWGIEDGWQVQVMWFYLTEATNFNNMLPEDTMTEMLKSIRGDFPRFPNYKTFGTKKGTRIEPALTHSQANILASFTEWSVTQNISDIERFLS